MRIALLTLGLGLAVWVGCSEGIHEPPCEAMGCEGARLCERPAEPDLSGPWPVGSREFTLGEMRCELWYPAAFGSGKSQARKLYRISDYLPPSEQAKIPEGASPVQTCDCYADLPIDAKRGPYPTIIFVHATASFRTQSLSQLVHWASRGFVVLAADHPGLKLADVLDFAMDADLEADLENLLATLVAPGGEAAFLTGHVDANRVGLIGHSAGGKAIAGFSDHPQVKVIIPMAYEGVLPGQQVEQVLVMGGIDDQVVAYQRQVDGYESSPAPKALAGFEKAGHLAFTDLCVMTNEAGQDLVEMAIAYQVKNAELASLLWDGCQEAQLMPPRSNQLINGLSTAAFESVLQCRAEVPSLPELAQASPDIVDFRAEP